MPNRNLINGCALAGFAALLLVGVVIGLPILRFTTMSNRHMTVRETIRFSVPQSLFEIQHSRIGINAIVAEYNRDITFIREGVIGKTSPLSIDTCGGYPINCYLIRDQSRTFIRLDDAVSEHILDLDSETTYIITRYQNKPYYGESTDGRTSSGWSMSNNDSSTLKVTIGDKEAKPMEQLTNGATERYIGQLTGGMDHLRFVPASESPERPIRHLFER